MNEEETNEDDLPNGGTWSTTSEITIEDDASLPTMP